MIEISQRKKNRVHLVYERTTISGAWAFPTILMLRFRSQIHSLWIRLARKKWMYFQIAVLEKWIQWSRSERNRGLKRMGCCSVSVGAALNARFTTNGMCVKNSTHMYVARTSNKRVIAAGDLSIVACCNSSKLSVHAARALRSQQGLKRTSLEWMWSQTKWSQLSVNRVHVIAWVGQQETLATKQPLRFDRSCYHNNAG